MTTGSVSLFINPTAGRGRAGRRLSRILEIFDQAGVEIELHVSRAVGDLEAQVLEKVNAGTSRIIVAGGDGSVHEAVNGIMRADNSARLGVIPSGTGNDFAKASAISLDWEHAARILAERTSTETTARRIDIGRMNDRYFANGAGVGFDAKVTRIARSYHWPIGDLIYLVAIFRCMVDGIASPKVTITAEDFHWSGPVTLVNVSNGPWVGGMFYIAPMADNSDGQLEMLIVEPVSRLRLAGLLPKLMQGTHVDESEITHTSVRRLQIEAAEPIQSHMDGEVGEMATHFDIEILPEALELI